MKRLPISARQPDQRKLSYWSSCKITEWKYLSNLERRS